LKTELAAQIGLVTLACWRWPIMEVQLSLMHCSRTVLRVIAQSAHAQLKINAGKPVMSVMGFVISARLSLTLMMEVIL